MAPPSASPAVTGEVTRTRDTRHAVARALLDGPATAAVLAERLALTSAGIRRHLDALLADGLIEGRDQHTRGPRGRGRPARAFVLTALGREEFHQAYDALATDAMAFLRESAGDAAVAEFARRRLSGLGDRLRPAVDGAAPGQRVPALAEALTAEGYPAAVGTTDAGGVQLCQHHCPVAHAAEAFPELCAAETEMLSALLGTHVQRLATIAHGDGVCTTHIPGPVPDRAVLSGAAATTDDELTRPATPHHRTSRSTPGSTFERNPA